MASGQMMAIWELPSPTGDFAPLSTRAGGSTPAEAVACWLFDAAAIEYRDFGVYLAGYDGGGLTLTLPWAAASATANATRWGAAFRWLVDDTDDIDGSHTYDYNDVDDACASASGELSYAAIAFTDGSDMDSGANGMTGILRIRRNASHGNDTMSGDAMLLMPVLKEA